MNKIYQKSFPGVKNAGFTLIELLVVVLIIGILASVAVPQYQKVVWRSRNTELKSLLATIKQAQEVYYMANGTYATQFGQLDIDIPLKSGGGACNFATDGSNDAKRIGDKIQVILNTYAGSSSIVAVWTNGKYKCTGFVVRLTANVPLRCIETRNGASSVRPGEFCIDIEHGQLETEGDSMTAARYILS